MAGKFALNSKVQTVDELGRWCDGRILEIGDDDLFVCFPGYPDSSLRVAVDSDKVRERVLPYEQQLRGNPDLVRSRRGKKLSLAHRQLLSSCQRGDSIITSSGRQVVDVVDPFNRQFCLDDGSIVAIQDVLIASAEEEASTLHSDQHQRGKKRKSSRRRTLCQEDSVPVPLHRHQDRCTPTEHDVIQYATQDETRDETQDTALEGGHHHEHVFQVKDIKCGSLYKVKELGIILIISYINLMSGVCGGWPVVGEEVRREMNISVPAEALERVKEKQTRKVKCLGDKLWKESLKKTANNCKEESFRLALRRDQLQREFSTCVKQALCSRSHKRSLDMGLMNPEIDFKMLGVHPPKSYIEYCYRNMNMIILDPLLGLRWDVVEGNMSCRFVTSVRVKITSHLHLHIKIKTAEYPASLENGADYRSIFHTHMLQLAL